DWAVRPDSWRVRPGVGGLGAKCGRVWVHRPDGLRMRPHVMGLGRGRCLRLGRCGRVELLGDGLADADAAGGRHRVGDRLVEHLLEHAAGEAAAEEAVLRGADFGEDAAQKVRLQRARGLIGILDPARHGCLYSTWSSARSAPAAFKAWKMAARSRGLTPSWFSAAATCPTVAAPLMTWSLPSFSSTFTSLCGVTTAWPPVNAPGCDTCGFSLTSTLIAP